MCHKTLPQGYTQLDKIDLQKNRKQFWTVNILSWILFLIVLGIGILIVVFPMPVFDFEVYHPLSLIAGMFLYIILHEAVHGVFMFAFSHVKPHFGFTGVYAYAGSTAYFDKKHYLVVSLAPLVVWGIVFGVLSGVFYASGWFVVFWILQAINVSGAAGDIYVSCKMATYPKDILVLDTGTDMTVYRSMTEEELAAQVQQAEVSEEENQPVQSYISQEEQIND